MDLTWRVIKLASPKTPILLDHDSTRVVGQADKVDIGASSVGLSGQITDDGPDGMKVVGNAKNGFVWQASGLARQAVAPRVSGSREDRNRQRLAGNGTPHYRARGQHSAR